MGPVRRFINRLGWTLMGYPAAVGYRRIVIDPMPGWERLYRLGIRLHNWNPADDR